MCGVVQNVSRPMLSCQEMSHAPPITLEITAMTQDHTYQGIDSAASETWAAVRACTWDATEIESAMARLRRKTLLHNHTHAHGGSYILRSDNCILSRFFEMARKLGAEIVPPCACPFRPGKHSF